MKARIFVTLISLLLGSSLFAYETSTAIVKVQCGLDSSSLNFADAAYDTKIDIINPNSPYSQIVGGQVTFGLSITRSATLADPFASTNFDIGLFETQPGSSLTITCNDIRSILGIGGTGYFEAQLVIDQEYSPDPAQYTGGKVISTHSVATANLRRVLEHNISDAVFQLTPGRAILEL